MDNTPFLADNNNHGKSYELKKRTSSFHGKNSTSASDRKKTTVTAEALGVGNADAENASKGGIGKVFWKRLSSILKIAFKSPTSGMAMEIYVIIIFKLLSSYVLFLITSTANSKALPPLYYCEMDKFWPLVFEFAWMMTFYSVVNSLALYWAGRVRLRARTKVTEYLQNKLFEKPNGSLGKPNKPSVSKTPLLFSSW